MEKIILVLGDISTDSNVIATYPDRITAILEANADVSSVQIANCSAKQLLDFLLEMQKYAVETHIRSSTEKR